MAQRVMERAFETRAVTGRKKESSVAYIETGTASQLFYLKYISKVLQDPGKESIYQNNNCLMAMTTECWTP